MRTTLSIGTHLQTTVDLGQRRDHMKEVTNIMMKNMKEQKESDNDNHQQNTMMQVHMHRRRLTKNTPETRLNKLMDDFRNLDTFIDVKSLLKDLTTIEENYDMKSKSSTPSIHEEASASNKTNYTQNYLEPYYYPFKKMINKANTYINRNKTSTKSHLLDNFLKKINKTQPYLRLSQTRNSFEESVDKILQVCHDYVCRNTVVNPMIFNKNSQKQEQIDEQYYKKFKQKAEDIETKLHEMLEVMHHRKWRKKEQQKQDRSHTFYKYKPFLDEKYKIFACSGYFRFRKNGKSQDQRKKNAKTLSKTVEISKRYLASQVYIKRPKEKVKTYTNQIRRIKQEYSFKKPLVKGYILNKIVNFIDDVETQQYELKKKNVYISTEISRLEQNKVSDFARFFYEKIVIDEYDMRDFVEKTKQK